MHTTEMERIETREERGMNIAARVKLGKAGKEWIVPSQSGSGRYVVDPNEDTCTCPDYVTHAVKCKHIWAVEFTRTREAESSEGKKRTVRTTYQQDWGAYNQAQTNEGEMFGDLLSDLCQGIPQPPQTRGRPRLPISDVVFLLVSKTYSNMSGRRFTSNLRAAQDRGLVDKAAHYNSGFRYLEQPALTQLLKSLIEQSAAPLRAVESDFAVDSSGFSTSTYARWYDHKWGKVRKEAKWVKAHLMCGVRTNIVTSVEVTPTESADAPFLPHLLERTAETFSIREVSGDKAYSSRKNLHAVEAVGGVPYIPFKKNTTGVGKSFDGLWNRMWHYYHFNQRQFLEHYHKRSNAETTFAMIKGKFGASVRAKKPVAQVNEVLCKVLAHNICVLIQSVYELGLEPVFWASRAGSPLASEVPHMSHY